MAATNINRVVVSGNLTRDPELRSTPGGTSVCSLRIAVNSRRKDESGQWVDKPNYFDVTVWGAQGENCAQYLAKGRPVAVDGRLNWREWEAKDGVQAAVRRYHCRLSAVPGFARRVPRATARSSPTCPPTPPTSSRPGWQSGGGSDDDIPF